MAQTPPIRPTVEGPWFFQQGILPISFLLVCNIFVLAFFRFLWPPLLLNALSPGIIELPSRVCRSRLVVGSFHEESHSPLASRATIPSGSCAQLADSPFLSSFDVFCLISNECSSGFSVAFSQLLYVSFLVMFYGFPVVFEPVFKVF